MTHAKKYGCCTAALISEALYGAKGPEMRHDHGPKDSYFNLKKRGSAGSAGSAATPQGMRGSAAAEFDKVECIFHRRVVYLKIYSLLYVCVPQKDK